MIPNSETPQKSVLLLYSSRFGQSRKIAEAVAREMPGRAVEIAELTDTTQINRARYAALALVMSVRYGHFARAAFRFVEAEAEWLSRIPTLLITVSLTARKPEKRDPQKHSYTRKFLAKTGWRPTLIEVAAGALEYPRYNPLDRACIRLIMWLMGGETDGVSVVEYTDWEAIRRIARQFCERIAGTGG